MTDNGSSMNGVNGSGTGKTGEATLPGRCPTVGQGEPGRRPATARMKWRRNMNIAVMEWDSKDTKEGTIPVRRRKRETWDLW